MSTPFLKQDFDSTDKAVKKLFKKQYLVVFCNVSMQEIMYCFDQVARKIKFIGCMIQEA